MTVREKTALSKSLAKQGIKAVFAKSSIVGELQIQCIGHDGKLTTVFLPSSLGLTKPRLVNLLDYGPVSSWRESRSLLNAVRLGHVSVTLD